MKWWQRKKRSLGEYNFEDGCVQILVWGEDIATADALDMAETMIALKRKELATMLTDKPSRESGAANE
jgi:hypothetical protein